MTVCEVWSLGTVAYPDALMLQNRLVDERAQSAPDRLLLLQHPHTYTLGTSGHEENLLMPAGERQQRGVAVFRVDRGGDITYHGPGQLVGYPIMQLPRQENTGLRADVVGYVRRLEQVIICTLADFGIISITIPGLTGVWVGEEKICAIGVRVNTRAVTKHGFALNINSDLRYFNGIVPCGIRDKGVTSMAHLLGETVDENRIIQRLVQHFGRVFGVEMLWLEQPQHP